MADKDVNVLTIDTSGASSSLKELRQHIKDLKSEILGLEEGTAEYNQKLIELGNANHQMIEVNEQMKQTTQDFGDRISNVSGTLAGASGAVQTVVGAFSLMGVEMGDDVKILKTLQSLMAITSGVAAIDSGVKAFKALTISIKASVSAMSGMKKAMLASGIGAAIVAIGTLVAYKDDFVDMFDNGAKAAANFGKQVKKTIEAQERQKESNNFQIEYAEAVGKSATAVDKLTRNLMQQQVEQARLMALEAMRRKSEAHNGVIFHRAYDNAKEAADAAMEYYTKLDDEFYAYLQKSQIESVKRNREAGKAAKETQQQLADALAQRLRLNGDEMGALNMELASLEKQQNAVKKGSAAWEELQNKIIETRTSIGNLNNDMLQAKADRLRIDGDEIGALNMELAIMKNQQAAVSKESVEYQNYANKIEETTRAIQQLVSQRKISEEQQQVAMQQEQQRHNIQMQNMAAMSQINDEDLQQRLLSIETQRHYYEQLDQLETRRIDDETNILTAQLNAGLITAEEYAQGLNDIDAAMNAQAETNAQHRIEIAKSEADAKKAIQQNYYNAIKSITGSLTNVLGTIGDTLEEGSKEWKNVKIAEATISTIAGAIDAYMGMVKSIPGPIGIAAGAAAAAATLAAGMAEIDKIRSTEISTTGSSGTSSSGSSFAMAVPNGTAVDSLTTQVTNTRQTSTNNDIANMPETRVYVLESDITDTQYKKKVTISNATY
jgi:hypothetical protein